MNHEATPVPSHNLVAPPKASRMTSRTPVRTPSPPPSVPSRTPPSGLPAVPLRERWKSWYVFPAVALVVAISAMTAEDRRFPEGLRVDVGGWAVSLFEWFTEQFAWLYEPAALQVDAIFDALLQSLTLVAPPILVAVVVCAALAVRGLSVAVLAVCTFGWLILVDLWNSAMETVAFMLIAVVASAAVGLALGLLGSLNRRSESAVRLAVDAMQAYPAFAYMVPAIVIFGVGNPAAFLCTIIWAAPPLAKMTSVGLRSVDPDVIEAAIANGARRAHILFKVKLPMAAASIRAGLNQTIMFAIAMATMAAMIGADGLGAPVWSGLSRLAFGDALEAGIGLVLVAILLDRLSSPASERRRDHKPVRLARVDVAPRTLVASALLLVTVVATLVGRGPWQNFGDPSWGKLISLREPVGSTITWLNTTWGTGFDTFRDTVQSIGLNPLASFFESVPWFITVGCTALVAFAVNGRSFALFAGLGVLGIGALGMWVSTVETLAVVSTAVFLVVVVGFPIGVLMSASDRAAALIRPVLDVMQTLPVYLFVIPAVIILGTGEVAGVLGTFIAAIPPMIRFTNAALRDVDQEVVEAATTFGASPGQVLRQVRIPLGLPTLMVALNQTVILALAMAVVSAFIGSPGLGQDILYSLQRFDLARGVSAGLAMFFLAVIVDRVLRGSAHLLSTLTHSPERRKA